MSKLLDYRYTARKIKDGGSFNTFMAKYCGPITWGSFWVQIVTYSVGGIFVPIVSAPVGLYALFFGVPGWLMSN